MTDVIDQFLRNIKSKGLYRKRRVLSASLINFSNNDYLGLSKEEQVKNHYSYGSCSSMFVCGYQPIHQRLEYRFKELLNVDEGLLFSSGYTANLALINLLARLGYHLFIDKKVHASIYDGIKLASANFTRFNHNDLVDLGCKTKKASIQSCVFTEGIFSMSGQRAPLAEIVKQTQYLTFVDEAHSFGLIGKHGLGAVEFFKLSQREVPLRMIPFGKTLAAQGAIIVGQKNWLEALSQVARSNIYSTSLSPALCFYVLNNLERVIAMDDRRHQLQQLVHYFREKTKYSPYQWQDSFSAIQQLKLGCPSQAVALSEYLLRQGFICLPMRQPTVSLPDTGLRIVLSYCHSEKDIDQLFTTLHQSKINPIDEVGHA